ncbi:hypothetical protein A9975_06190 [Cupriavidus sp. UME77]|nr:hypothetical protein [Cupriavidus sp. UME77]
MRHGQPNLAMFGKVSARDMQRWIEQYDLSEIINQPDPEASVGASRRARSTQKALQIVEGASHYDLYDQPDATGNPLEQFVPFLQEAPRHVS